MSTHDKCIEDLEYHLTDFAGSWKPGNAGGIAVTVTYLFNTGKRTDYRVSGFTLEGSRYLSIKTFGRGGAEATGYAQIAKGMWEDLLSFHDPVQCSSFVSSVKAAAEESVDLCHEEIVDCAKKVLDEAGEKIAVVSLSLLGALVPVDTETGQAHFHAMWLETGYGTTVMRSRDVSVPIFVQEKDDGISEVRSALEELQGCFVLHSYDSYWYHGDRAQEKEEKKEE